MTNDKLQALLQAAGMTEGADEPIDRDSLANELSTSVETFRFELDQVQGLGLISLPGSGRATAMLVPRPQRMVMRRNRQSTGEKPARSNNAGSVPRVRCAGWSCQRADAQR